MPTVGKILFIKVRTLSIAVQIIGMIFAGLLFVVFKIEQNLSGYSTNAMYSGAFGMCGSTLKAILDTVLLLQILNKNSSQIKFWMKASLVLTSVIPLLAISMVDFVILICIITGALLNFAGLWIVFYYSLLVENTKASHSNFNNCRM